MQVKMRSFLMVFCIAVLLLHTGCTKEAAVDLENSAPGFPVVVNNYDSEGREVRYTYQRPPQKVLSTYPGATELLLTLGLDANIMATVAAYGAPPEELGKRYDALSILQAAFIPSQEEIFAMQPDFIIGWAHNFSAGEMGEVHNWQDRHIGTYIVPGTLKHTQPTIENSVYPFIADIGKIFGIEKRAQDYIDDCRSQVAVLQQKIGTMEKRPKVIILQEHGKSTYSLYGNRYIIDDIVQKAGGENLVKEQTSFVGPERILGYEPDYVIYVSYSLQPGKNLSDAEAKEKLQGNPEFQSMKAVMEGRIINVPFNDVNNCNGRVIEAMKKIAQGLYPDKVL
ncbi:MAG: ABC-type transporter, periplasmic subunit [Firmicutes bacterium]|nr:ABC-type transporter, periplasmic subunit [Bacillota bacterium]